jgi:threonine dehydratase
MATLAPLRASLDELEEAAALVRRTVPATPQNAWPRLGLRVGCEVWVKHENLTPTGAFKVRGGLLYLDRLKARDPDVRGVVCATRGNHGQSIALASARIGVSATVYVPRGNSPDQNAAMQAFGANVVVHGADFDEAKHEAARVAAAQRLHFVPSFHRDLVLGVASYALELFRGAPSPDAVYVGVGMGSGICGLILARDALSPRTEIIGVGASGAPAMARSYAERRVVTMPAARTFADGLATREPVAEAIATIASGAARMVLVDDSEIADAMRTYYDDTRQIAEGAAAAPLAALRRERDRMAGRRVALIMSGGNIERARLVLVLRGETP